MCITAEHNSRHRAQANDELGGGGKKETT